MDLQQTVFILEMIGTIAFAVSGAMVGITKKMDLLGVCVLGVVTSVGGGTIRDIILGILPPNVFRNSVYALVALVTSCIVFLTLYIKKSLVNIVNTKTYEIVMRLMDAIGLGIFTVVGVNTGFRYGHYDNLFLLVFLGTITGVGGGLMRDIMAGVPPYIFVRHVYASASIMGALICALLYKPLGVIPSMVISAGMVVLIRNLAAHYHWNLPKVSLDDEE